MTRIRETAFGLLLLAATLLVACSGDSVTNLGAADLGNDAATSDAGVNLDLSRAGDSEDSGWVDIGPDYGTENRSDGRDDIVAPPLMCDYGPIGRTSDEPRASSFQDCTGGFGNSCDVNEVCDFIHYDLLCDGPCDEEQTGDQRCHRVCDDGLCAEGERCEERPVYISDTPTMFVAMCVCEDEHCPIMGPGGEERPVEGGIAHWRDESGMPVDLYYHAAAVNEDFLVVGGGLTIAELALDGSSATLERVDRVYSAPIGHSDQLGDWREAGALPEPLIHHAMTLLGNRLYVAGGETDDAFTANVISAEIGSDGQLGTWRTEASLPAPRGRHAMLAEGDRLVILGGSLSELNFSNGIRTIWYADVDSSGAVDGWETVQAPDDLVYSSRPALSNGRLFLVSETGNIYSIDVDDLESPSWLVELERFNELSGTQLLGLCDSALAIGEAGRTWISPLNETLGEWRLATRFNGPAVGFTTNVSPNGRVYVTGGAHGRTPIERVNNVWSTSRE